jgi:tryptophanyl-tRNA synthetase
VPVGGDQKQHLELTRDIAQKFNSDFAVEFFPIVEPLIFGEATRVMSLRDGAKKMSKSDPSDQSRITFTDTADDISKKIRRAKTDADVLPSETDGLKGRPEAANLVGIYAALSKSTSTDVLHQFGGRGFGDFKPALADLAIEKLAPMSDEMRRLMADPAHIDAILADGAARARAIADPILADINEIVGLISS